VGDSVALCGAANPGLANLAAAGFLRRTLAASWLEDVLAVAAVLQDREAAGEVRHGRNAPGFSQAAVRAAVPLELELAIARPFGSAESWNCPATSGAQAMGGCGARVNAMVNLGVDKYAIVTGMALC
jgi:hypothetical protein